MFSAGAIIGELRLNTTNYMNGIRAGRRASREMKTDIASLKDSVGGLTLALAGTATAITAFFGNALRQAAYVQEAENLFIESMGNMADSTRAWSEQLQDSLGLNAVALREGVGMLNVMMTSMGIGEEAAAGMARNVNLLAADMSSFYNLPHEVALAKIRSGLVGSSEPLREIGILVDETTVAMTAWQTGLVANGQELTQQEKVIARYLSIMQQTTKAQGDLARTQDSFTNQTRMMRTQFTVLNQTIGGLLIPTAEKIVGVFGRGMVATVNWVRENEDAARKISMLTIGLGGAITALGTVAIIGPVVARVFRTIGLAAAVAWGAITSPIVLVVAAVGSVGVAVYSLRVAWQQNSDYMKKAWGGFVEKIRTSVELIKGYLSAIGAGIKSTAATVGGAVKTFAKSLVPSFMLTAIETGVNNVKSAGEAAAGVLEKLNDASGIGDAFSILKQDFLSIPKEMQLGMGALLESEFANVGGIINGITEQGKKDFDGFFEGFMGKAKSFAPGLGDALADGIAPGLEDLDIETLLQGLRQDMEEAGKGAGKAAGGGVSEAMREMEQLRSQGESLFAQLDSRQGLLIAARDGMEQLKAAGRLDDETTNLFGASLWQQFSHMSDNALSTALERIRELQGGVQLAEAVFMAMDTERSAEAAREAGRLAQERQSDLSRILDMVEPVRAALDDLAYRVELVKEAGRLDADAASVLVDEMWRSLGDTGVGAFDQIRSALSDFPPEVQEAFEGIVAEIEDVEQASTMEKAQQGLNMIAGTLGRLPGAWRHLATAARVASAAIGLATAIMSGDILAILSSVLELIDAFGILGNKSEKELKGMAKVMDEIKDASRQWIDDLSARIVQFARTGEATFKEFAQTVIDEIARIALSELIIRPVVGFAGGMLGFEDGGAFKNGRVIPMAKGRVVDGPTSFPLRGGNIGLMGEAGPEAVMPLTRGRDGKLGVSGTGGSVQVNVHAHGVDRENIRVNESEVNGQRVIDVVVNAVRSGINDGVFDRDFGTRFGVRRLPA